MLLGNGQVLQGVGEHTVKEMMGSVSFETKTRVMSLPEQEASVGGLRTWSRRSMRPRARSGLENLRG